MYYKGQSSARLQDSTQRGNGTELLVVEGESAARSVAAVRHAQLQGVLPLQGKPLNAWQATEARVLASQLYQQLADALGLPNAVQQGDAPRYEKLLLLLDPDADGIHIGALLLLYLWRWQPQLILQQRVWMVRAPMVSLEMLDADTGEISFHHAYTPAHARELQQHRESQGLALRMRHGYRGLGSLPSELLHDSCVHPDTRQASVVTPDEVQLVIEVFGGA